MQDQDPRPLVLTSGLAFGLGFAAQAGQTLLLREVLGQVEGTELVLGISLAGWLLAGAAGALVGRPLATRARDPARGLALAAALAATTIAVGVHAVRMVRGWLPLAPGEAPTVLTSMGAAALAAALPAAMLGLAFPFAARALGGARAYGAEAAGALVGGLAFTFVLSPCLAPLSTASLLLVLVAAAGTARCRPLAALVALGIAGVALGPWLERSSRQAAYDAYLPGFRLLATEQSRRGPLDVLGLPGQASLYRYGHLDATSPDPEDGAARAHVALSLHAAPRRVLVVGGGPAVLREILAEPVEHVAFVDPDPGALEVFREHLAPEDRAALGDPRLTLLPGDPRARLRDERGTYDVVAVFGLDPATAASNRFFTEEFYREAARALREDGVLVQGLPGAENLLRPSLMERNALVRRAARTAFDQVVVSPGEAGFLVAGSGAAPPSLDPAVLGRRFGERRVATTAFTEHHFDLLLQPGEAARVAAALDAAEGRLGSERNTDARPAAFFRTFLLRAEEGGTDLAGALGPDSRAGILVGLALLLLALTLRGPRGAASLASTGLASMGALGVILLAYQAARGDLYGEIGALGGTFMGGLAVGVRLRAPLLALDAATAAVLLALPFASGGVVGSFVAAGGVGILAGATFPAALRAGGDVARLYALDLLGSAVGAVLVLGVFVPTVGVAATCVGLAVAKGITLPSANDWTRPDRSHQGERRRRRRAVVSPSRTSATTSPSREP